MSSADDARGPANQTGDADPVTSLPWSGFDSPRAWVFTLVTEFVLGLAIGIASNIAATTLGAWLWIREAIVQGGDAVSGSVAYLGGGPIWIVNGLGSLFVQVNLLLGPFAIFVWVGLGLGFAFLLYRLAQVGVAAIPVVGPALESLFYGG